ncbi:MAG: hypothetical protein ACD_73C00777G0001 [uncultured bacterium]|nr:MAG: hypothetical protein ACD_73C00777G0001 [uncultured bacterium]
MPLFVYNTLTRQKEEFKPLHAPKVGMYVCGVTVYDECHLGHARALVNFDVIYRYLSFRGFDVTFVRNFTDVDDKIINKAIKEGSDWKSVAEKYIATFHRDVTALGLKPPTIEPKATEHIEEMLSLIGTLEKNGFAYPAGGDVFYKVRQKNDYGKLSGKKIEELESGARIEILEAKTDPLDFALWKGSKPGEPSWASHWGEGRPGWHIECSAMSMKYLGETFDIHGGGRDLSFPHHENEIAQSEAATGKLFAKYWLHNGFVNINAEKMSKSLGNFLTIREMLEKYHPEVLRLFILAAQYRSPLDYTEANINNARQSLIRWYTTTDRIQKECRHLEKTDDGAKDLEKKVLGLMNEFQEAMDDDFNTAKVTGILFDLVREWNRVLDTKLAVPQAVCEAFFKNVARISEVLGLFGAKPEDFLNDDKKLQFQSVKIDAAEIEKSIADRNMARKNKDWVKADLIRKELKEHGVEIKDNPDGTTSWSLL